MIVMVRRKDEIRDASIDLRVDLAEWIDAYLAEHRYAPTVRECAGYLGINLSSAHSHLAAMRRAGMVAWTPGDSRTLHTLRGWRQG